MTYLQEKLAPLRAKYPDAVFLVRTGNYYEAYSEDTQHVAKVCHLTATYDMSRHETVVQMHHWHLDVYLPKLIRAKYRVCICDELEAPKPKREQPAEVVTPNTNAL